MKDILYMRFRIRWMWDFGAYLSTAIITTCDGRVIYYIKIYETYMEAGVAQNQVGNKFGWKKDGKMVDEDVLGEWLRSDGWVLDKIE